MSESGGWKAPEVREISYAPGQYGEKLENETAHFGPAETREDARKIIESFLAMRGCKMEVDGIYNHGGLDKNSGGRSGPVCNIIGGNWAHVWVGYLSEKDDDFVGLRSSTGIVIAKSTGQVIYFGGMMDEG